MAERRKAKRSKEYELEHSPFYTGKVNLRSALNEIQSGDNRELVLARKRYYKQDDYVKVITTNDIDITLYYKLGNMAKTVMFYIICNCLEFNNPAFKLTAEELKVILGLTSNKPIYKAINELIDVEYIARTDTREVYWINFNLFYKGVYVVDKFLKEK